MKQPKRSNDNDLGPWEYTALHLAISMVLSGALVLTWDVSFGQAMAAIWTIRFLAMTGRS